MSVCDEGWELEVSRRCPCLDTYSNGDPHSCIWKLWNSWFPDDGQRKSPLATCPFATILKALPRANIHHKIVQDVNADFYDVWTVAAEREKVE